MPPWCMSTQTRSSGLELGAYKTILQKKTMKKILALLISLSLCLGSFGQSCEERENALLTALGSVSGGFVYNTYSTIGAVCDGFVKKIYDGSSAQSIIEEQVTLIESTRKSMQDIIDKKMLKDNDDVSYVNDLNNILDGLKKQANLLLDYIKTNNTAQATAFGDQ